MIKRPLNKRFSQAVLDGRKTTSIRKNPWPVGKLVMLYNWSGAAYRSPQIDVEPVMVDSAVPITITHLPSGLLLYDYDWPWGGDVLWVSEGFESGHDMDEWFRPLVKRGQSVTNHLMRFRLANAKDDESPRNEA